MRTGPDFQSPPLTARRFVDLALTKSMICRPSSC